MKESREIAVNPKTKATVYPASEVVIEQTTETGTETVVLTGEEVMKILLGCKEPEPSTQEETK